MKQKLLFLITAFILCIVAGCSSTKKAIKTDVREEATITAASDKQTHQENTEKVAILTTTESNEKKNVVIDFTTVEFFPGKVPQLPEDSTCRRDCINAILAATSEEVNKAKPPNVKRATKGRIIINGEKQQETETKADAKTTATKDSHSKENVAADQKTEDNSTTEETKEKPGFTLVDWIYTVIVVGFSIYAIIIGVRTARKMHKTAKGNN